MKALSIRQPYASLIVEGVKDIENRTTRTHFRGKVYIHASAKWHDRAKSKDARDLFPSNQQYNAIPNALAGKFLDRGVVVIDDEIPISAIIGEVEIIDCVVNHHSIWAEKTEVIGKTIEGDPLYKNKPNWNWVLANPVLYEKPILNVKGKLSFWEPDIDIQECIGCSQKFDLEEMEEDDGGEKFCPECWEVLSPVMAQEAKENAAESE